MQTPESVTTSSPGREAGLATAADVHAPSAVQGIEVRVLRSVEEAEEFRGTWEGWPGHRDSNIDFFFGVVAQRPEFLRPHIIVVYRDSVPEAMLIGRIERTKLNSKIGYLRLPGIPLRGLTFGYGTLRGNPSEQGCRALVTSIMVSLRQGEADIAFLHHNDAGSNLYRMSLELPGFFSRDHLPRVAARHCMRLPGNLDEIFAGLSRDHRSELRRKTKKLDAAFAGKLKVERLRDAAGLDEVIPQVEKIAKKTYQRGIGVGFEDNPHMRHRLGLCAEKKWLRIYTLSIDDQPVSFWVGTVVEGNFSSDYLGFDPTLGDYSPGNYLMLKMFEDLCAEKVQEIDFGSGEGRYKERFGNLTRQDAPVFIFAPTPKGILLNAMRTTSDGLDRGVKRVLERTNLLPKIKRLWRRRASHAAQV